jgi:hypothetical protein
MRTLLSFLLYTLFSYNAFCQSGIIGYVKESDNKNPLEYATVSLHSPDSIFITGTITDSTGYFYFDKTDIKDYMIRCSMVGYEQEWFESDQLRNNIIEINLKPSSNQLQEISVVAQRPPIQNRGEKMIINLDSYMQTKGKNTVDILRILPGIVSERESFSLMGKSVTVYINDKPSNLTGTDLTNYLSTLQGDQIEKIELIANPSARFDAGYNGAIVNIKLKKDATLGLNGSISNTVAAWGKNKYETPSVTLNYRNKYINAYGGYSYMHSRSNNIIEYTRRYNTLATPVQYNENGDLNMTMNYHSYNAGIDYTFSDKHELNLLLKGSTINYKNPNDTRTEIRRIGSDLIDSLIVSPIKMKTKNYDNQVNLAHKWNIDTAGTTLNTNINYMNVNSKNFQRIPLYYQYPNGSELREPNGNGQDVKQNMNLWTAKIDFHKSFLKDGGFDAGIKYDNIKRTNDLFALSYLSENWIENTDQSNDYDYKEQIYAAYLNLDKTVNKFYFSLGLRGEGTIQKGFQHANNQSFRKDYFDLFPSAFAQYNLKNNQSVVLSYNRKIARPSFSMMNPFKFFTSPQTYQEGNPDLTPNYINSYSLKYTRKQSYIDFQHTYSKGQFVQEAFQDDETKILGYYYINFGSVARYRLSIYHPIQLFAWWKVSLNGSVNYNDNESLLNGENFSKRYWSYSGSIHNTFTITKSLSADLYSNINSGSWYSTLRIKSRGYLEASVTQQLWNDRAYISLGVTDPFRWNTFRSENIYKNINERTKEINNARTLKISFQYKFGSDKIRKNRSRSTGVEDIQSRSY